MHAPNWKYIHEDCRKGCDHCNKEHDLQTNSVKNFKHIQLCSFTCIGRELVLANMIQDDWHLVAQIYKLHRKTLYKPSLSGVDDAKDHAYLCHTCGITSQWPKSKWYKSGWEQDGKNICLCEGVTDSKLEYEGLHEYYCSAYTIRFISSWRMRWAWHVECITDYKLC